MEEQPKKSSIKETLIQERKGEHIRNKDQQARENREITEIIGMSHKDYVDVDKNITGDFDKRYNRTSGRVRTLNRAIKQHQSKIDQHIEELKLIKGGFTPFIKLLNPNVQLKKPRDNFPYWKGRIWFNMGYNPNVYGFNVKGRNIDVHICSEKERVEKKYSEKDMKEIGVRKFRQKILESDFGILKQYQR